MGPRQEATVVFRRLAHPLHPLSPSNTVYAPFLLLRQSLWLFSPSPVWRFHFIFIPFRKSTKTRTQGATVQYCVVKRSCLPCPAARSISGTFSEGGESGRNLTCMLHFLLVCRLFVHSEQFNVYFTLNNVIVLWVSTGPHVGPRSA